VGTVISGFGPLLVVVGPLLTVLYHFAPVGGRGPETTELPGGAKKRPEHSQVLRSSVIDRFLKFLHLYIQR